MENSRPRYNSRTAETRYRSSSRSTRQERYPRRDFSPQRGVKRRYDDDSSCQRWSSRTTNRYPQQENDDRRKRARTDNEEVKPKALLPFIDTHCHLDFLFNKLRFRGTFSDFRRSTDFPSSYEGCIAIFCKPETFKMKSMWRKFLDDKNIWGAFGCHPHNADKFDDDAEEHLKEALKHPNVVALGEIGLDYSDRNDVYIGSQRRVFRQQIKIAVQLNLPLVIHSRDAYVDTMEMMRKYVPLDYKIHRHCFTGNWDEAKVWLDVFPNLCIGITNVVNYSSAKDVQEVAKNIPLDRLLLETDAPYFGLGKRGASNPGMALDVAYAIAKIRNIDVNEVLHHARTNTRRIYSI